MTRFKVCLFKCIINTIIFTLLFSLTISNFIFSTHTYAIQLKPYYSIGDWVTTNENPTLVYSYSDLSSTILCKLFDDSVGQVTAISPDNKWLKVNWTIGARLANGWVINSNKIEFVTSPVFINNYQNVPHIHQCLDTKGVNPVDDFTGRYACGPTTAVMALAFLGKLEPDESFKGKSIFTGNERPSKYGKYVNNVYSAFNYPFIKEMEINVGGGFSDKGAGAWGHMITTGGTFNDYFLHYLKLHNVNCDNQYDNFGNPTKYPRDNSKINTFIINAIQNNHLIISSGNLHYKLIIGYCRSKDYFIPIVLDPYGDHRLYNKYSNISSDSIYRGPDGLDISNPVAYITEWLYSTIDAGRPFRMTEIYSETSNDCHSDVPTNCWKGEYYNDQNNPMLKMVRNDGCSDTLNLDWGNRAPDDGRCGMWDNRFLVNWTKTTSFLGGNYIFSVQCDDRCQIRIDGSLVIDLWDNPPYRNTYKKTINIAPGQHEIFIKYHEDDGDAYINLSWSQESNKASVYGYVRDDITKNPIPSVLVSCDENTSYTDQNGYYLIDGLSIGIKTVTFTKEGYKKYTQTSVDLSLNGKELNVNLQKIASNGNNPSPSEVNTESQLLCETYKIPSIIIKAVAEVESGWKQYDPNWVTNGIGIMQIDPIANKNSWPYLQLGSIDTSTSEGENSFKIIIKNEYVDEQKLKDDWKYNLKIGVQILLAKKYFTDGKCDDSSVLENWYYPLVGYNGFSDSNDPAVYKDKRFLATIKPGNNYDDFKSKKYFPYQECVYNVIAGFYKNPEHEDYLKNERIRVTLPGPIDVRYFEYVDPDYKYRDSISFYNNNKVRLWGESSDFCNRYPDLEKVFSTHVCQCDGCTSNVIGSISGTVTDCKTNALLYGVKVSCDGKSATTNGNGFYKIEGLSMGIKTVTFSRRGYTDQSGSVNLSESNNDPLSLCMNPILETGSIYGNITDCKYFAVLPGVSVSCGSITTTTDNNGYYKISEIPLGYSTVFFKKSGYEDKNSSVTLTNDNISQPLSLCLDEIPSEPTGSISGIVRDCDALSPIEGVKVYCDGQTQYTNTSGYYKISNLSITAKNIYFSKADSYGGNKKGESSAIVVLTENDKNKVLDFCLVRVVQKGSLFGYVTDCSTSVALSDVQVSCDGKSISTNTAGYYRIDDITPGAKIVSFSKTGYASLNQSINLIVRDTELNICLIKGSLGSISGYVRDCNSNELLSNVSVSCDSKSVTTDSNGFFNIDGLLPVSKTVIFSKPGYIDKSISVVLTDIDKSVTITTCLEILPTGSIFGTVRDCVGGLLSGVTVSCNEDIVTTDQNGFYSIKGLSQGTKSMSFSKSGYVSHYETVELSLSNRDINLSPCLERVPTEGEGSISGYVTDCKTGLFLSGVFVKCEERSSTTDQNGYYNIEHLSLIQIGEESGTHLHKVYFKKTGYEDRIETYDVRQSNNHKILNTCMVISSSYLPPPILYSPPNNELFSSSMNSIKFIWGKINNAVEYRLQIFEGSSFPSNEANTKYFYNECHHNKTTAVVYGFKPGKTYVWRVRCYNLNKSNYYKTSNWSQARIFRIQNTTSVILPPPTLYSPPNNELFSSSMNSIKLIWGKINNAVEYRLQVYEGTSFPSNEANTKYFYNDVLYNTNNTIVKGFKPGKTYVWRVRCGNYLKRDIYKTSNWSWARIFRIQSKQRLVFLSLKSLSFKNVNIYKSYIPYMFYKNRTENNLVMV